MKYARRQAKKLTLRQQQVAHLVVRGLSNHKIGDELGLTEGTVKIHIHEILLKLALENRTEVATTFHGFRFSHQR